MERIEINRAPVLTLWGVVVAQRMGYDREAALTLGRRLAGLNAQAKGRRLAGAFGVEELPAVAFGLYERFRPQIPPGRAGWGAKGLLDLKRLAELAE